MWSSLFATTFVGRMRRVVSYSPLSATGTRKTLTRAAELGRARSTAAANRSKYSSVTLDIIARMRRSAASGWVPCFSVNSVCAVGISSPWPGIARWAPVTANLSRVLIKVECLKPHLRKLHHLRDEGVLPGALARGHARAAPPHDHGAVGPLIGPSTKRAAPWHRSLTSSCSDRQSP